MRQHVIPVIAAAVIVAAGLGGRAAADPPETVTVTPSGPSTLSSIAGPLAGSADWLVYSVQARVASGPGDPQLRPGSNLFARSSTGRTVALGADPAQGNDTVDGYSLVQNTFVEEVHTTDGYDDAHIRDLSDGSTAEHTLPAGSRYLTGAPGGALLVRGENLLELDADGTLTDLGRPIPGSGNLEAVAGDDGAVITNGVSAVYLRFGQAPTYRSLLLGDAEGIYCSAAVGAYAACQDSGPDGAHVLLVPLDGTREPTAIPVDGQLDSVTLAGATLLFSTEDPAEYYSGHLFSFGYGATSATGATYEIGSSLVSALGVAASSVGTGNNYGSPDVLRLTSASAAARTLLTTAPSPIVSVSFSLSPGRLVDVDDRRISGVEPISTFGTAVATDSRPPAVGATRILKAGSSPMDALGSGSTTVYGLPGAASAEDLVLHAPRNSTTIRRALPGSSLALSGNRLLYRRGGDAYVYDASTATTTAVPTAGYQGDLALSGQDLAYQGPGGAIRRMNLVTGQSVQVSGALNTIEGDYSLQLFSYGDYVGWNYESGDADNGEPVTITHAYRDVKTMGPIIKLPQTIQQLSNAGVTLSSYVDSTPYPFTQASYSLHTWAGRSLTLLPMAAYAAPPQITNTTVAWGDDLGRLRVAPLTQVFPTAPRFLGATIAPRALAHPGHKGWQAFAPFDGPLTSCTAVISRPDRVDVRRLPCSAALMTIGVADFSWDGRYHGHVAPRGTYYYRIEAAARAGAVRNVFGDVAAPVAKIAVG